MQERAFSRHGDREYARYVSCLAGRTRRWGFAIPYMITGYLNQHPRAAMKFMEEGDGKDIVRFFDAAIEEE